MSPYDIVAGYLPVCYAYIVLGALAMISNAFVLLVYLSRKKFCSRYMLLIGLAVADLTNGLAFMLTGTSFGQ